MSPVLLVLPPMIETNFGQVYPSTAVLAAHLETRGIDCDQIDLNDRFLDHLTSPRQLDLARQGVFARSRDDHRAAAAWTQRRLTAGTLTVDDLRTAAGNSALTPIVRKLASPYLLDPPRGSFGRDIADPAARESYHEFFVEHLAALPLDSTGPQLVGLSAPMGPQLLPSLLLARVLRAHGPETLRIVIGGPSLSLLDDDDLALLLRHNPAIDAAVRYDGEHPLAALAEQHAEGVWKPSAVPGVSTLTDGRVVHHPPAPGPKLDDLPTPHYDLPQLRRAGAKTLGVYQARGCYWGKCDYCDFVEVYKGSRSYRGRRPERVVDDIATLVERTGVSDFRLITESIPPAFARRFSELLIERALPVTWSSFAMVDRRFDPELLSLMARSGCSVLVVGLESMVTRVLELVHKSADREENRRFLHDAHAAGIGLKVNLIPDLPTTTFAEAMQGLEDLREIAGHIDSVSVFGFEPTRSSNVGRSPASFGFVPISSIRVGTHAQFEANTLAVVDPAMTDEERATVMATYRKFADGVNQRRTAGVPVRRGEYLAVVPGAPTLTFIDLLDGRRTELATPGTP